MTGISAAVAYFVPSAVSMAMPLLTLPIMTRWLTPADYGVVALGQVVAGFFVGIAGLGVTSAAERNFFEHETDRRRLGALIHSALAIVALGTLVWAIVLYFARDLVSAAAIGTPGYGGVILMQCLTAATGIAGAVQLVYLRNRGRAREFMWLSLASVLGEAGLSILGVAVFRLGVWGLVGGALAGKILVVGVWTVRMARELPLGFDRVLARDLLAVGLPLVPRTFVSVFDGGLDRLILAWLGSLGGAGMFALANRVGYSVFSVMTSIEQVYVPQVYRFMFQRTAGAVIGRYVSPYFYAGALLAAGVALFVEEALWILVTPAFYDIKYPAAILTVYYGQMFFGKMAGAQFLYARKTWYATPIALVRLAVHGLLALTMVPAWGMVGAGLALLGTGIVVDSGVFLLARRTYPVVYEGRVVFPMFLFLYVVLGWTTLAGAANLPYAVRLAGKVGLFATGIALGRPWWAEAVGRVRSFVRELRLPVGT